MRNIRIIDTDILRDNVRILRQGIPSGARLMATVKSDGYGHGMIQTARAALAGGADALAVAVADEGALLRQNGISVPILVLGAVTPDDAEKSVREDLTCTVCTPDMVMLCEEAAKRLGKTVRVHMKIDTGMGRIGVQNNDERDRVLRALAQAPHTLLTGAFTHFADADGNDEGIRYTREQFRRFLALTEPLGNGVIRHCANSAAIQRFPEMALDMVRAGISMYGYPPVTADPGLKPAMTWQAEVSFVKEVPAGTPISYGRTWSAKGPARIATVTCGYGDGYHRAASGQAEVLIHGCRAKIVGNICMDQMMADVTDIPDVAPGDPVTLMGNDGNETIRADEIAAWAGTISYEILLAASDRVFRYWKGTGSNE